MAVTRSTSAANSVSGAVTQISSDLSRKRDIAPTQNNQTGTSYTFTLADASNIVTSNNSSSVTFTVPPQSSVSWVAGTILNVINYGTGTLTIAGGSGVTVTNASTTASQYVGLSIIRNAQDSWTVVPLWGSGKPPVTGYTGNPTTTTFISGGITYDVYQFWSSGSITLQSQVAATAVIAAGGGGGGTGFNPGGGGAGGILDWSGNIPVGTHTITVGGGGSAGSNGANSSFGSIASATGGGRGGSQQFGYPGANGGSGGGSGWAGGGGVGLGTAGQGNNGGDQGTGTQVSCGGGGGKGGVGGSGNASGNGGSGGAGTTITITGGSFVAGGGGGGYGVNSSGSGGSGVGGASGSNAVASTASGGGAGASGSAGFVIIRIPRA